MRGRLVAPTMSSAVPTLVWAHFGLRQLGPFNPIFPESDISARSQSHRILDGARFEVASNNLPSATR